VFQALRAAKGQGYEPITPLEGVCRTPSDLRKQGFPKGLGNRSLRGAESSWRARMGTRTIRSTGGAS